MTIQNNNAAAKPQRYIIVVFFIALTPILLLANTVQAGTVPDLIFKSGLETLYTLSYSADTNGSIVGQSLQIIEHGSDGTAVSLVANSGYHFVNWSDGLENNPRIDSNVQSNITVTANFELDVVYGQSGSHAVAPAYLEPNNQATIYYPTDASAENKVPVVFLSPGWGSTDPNRYKTLLTFIASHGFAAIYAQDKSHWSPSDQVVDYLAMINDVSIKPLLDTTRIGVIGHSLGGGHTFGVLDLLSSTPYNYGANGRFLFAIEPWFAFDMQQEDMLALPSNTNAVIQQYGIGGYNAVNQTDVRIPLTEFYLLESIAENKKDYQVYNDANIDHYYPYDDPIGGPVDYAGKQVILAPLDALMQFTFVDSNNMVAHDTALEVGNDDPYADGNGIQQVFPRGDARYAYPCNGYNFVDFNIDFCDIKGYPYAGKLVSIPTNNATIQPPLLGTSTDAEFATTISRLTERVLQNDVYQGVWNGGSRGNAHPYPKTQAWNADMTMIRMNYRIYDATTLLEIPLTTASGNYPLTTNTWDTGDLYYINGALNERKWSTLDPNVFYGVYLSGTNGQFWQGIIDRGNNLVNYPATPIHHFAGDYEKFSLGKFEGNLSYDDNFVVFAARKTNQNYLTAIVYDKATDTVLAQKDFDGTNGNAFIEWTDAPAAQVFDWISVSPLANYVLISTDTYIEQYDMNLNFIRHLSTDPNHADLGIAQDGEEVYVQIEFVDPGIWVYKLSDGTRTQLLPEKYNGGHVSCRNYLRPGWCYLSVTKEGYREVFALRINFADMSKHVVNRFAQTHTRSYEVNGVSGYSMNSLGNVSPDGKRVLFYTDWQEDPLDYYDRDTYQAQRVD